MYDIAQIPVFDGISIPGLETKLEEIVLERLNYDITDDDIKLDFITGYNDKERSLPAFDTPVIVKDYKGHTHIVTDLRKYCRKIDEKPIQLADILNNRAAGLFVINRAIMNLKLLNDEIGSFKTVQNSMTAMFAFTISTAINQLVMLNPAETLDVEIIASIYLTNKFAFKFSPKERKDIYPGRVSQLMLTYGTPRKERVKEVMEGIDTEMVSLEDLIKEILTKHPDLKGKVNLGSLMTSVSSWWFGPGGAGTMISHFEHLPTLLALYYTVVIEPAYKKNKLSMIAHKNKKRLNFPAIESMKKIIKEYSEV